MIGLFMAISAIGKIVIIEEQIVLTISVVFLLGSLLQAQIDPIPPEARSKVEVESILARAPEINSENLRDLHIVLLACEKDHGLNEHDYPLWQKNWKMLLDGNKNGSSASKINLYGSPNKVDVDKMKAGAPNVKVTTAWEWPSKEQFQKADLIAAFSVINWTKERNSELREFLSRGGGFVPIHMACVVGEGVDLDDEVAELIGLDWNWDFTRWRHGPMNLDIAKPDHPICLGLPKELYFMDEAYWPLHGNRSKVNIIATSKETIGEFNIRDKDGNHVWDKVNSIQQKWPKEPTKDEPMFWTYEYGKGRVYGCILGHYTWTFDDPYFRILLLRGMAWAAGESPYRFDPLILRGATVK